MDGNNTIKMITYKTLLEKFEDKGYMLEFLYYILTPPCFEPGKGIGTIEQQLEQYKRVVEKTYGESWEYWNQWIDRQNYK